MIIYPSTDVAGVSGARLSREQPYSIAKRWQINGSNNTNPTIKAYFPAHKHLGITKARYKADDPYTALVTANPATPVYLHIVHFDPVGVADVQTTALYNLTQYVEFFDRKIPALS